MQQSGGLDFFLMRYVPRLYEQAHINIGVLAISSEGTFAATRFLADWEKVLSLDPDADVELLEAMSREISGDWSKEPDRTALLRRMETSLSNTIQLSSKMFSLSDDLEKETDRLAAIYL